MLLCDIWALLESTEQKQSHAVDFTGVTMFHHSEVTGRIFGESVPILVWVGQCPPDLIYAGNQRLIHGAIPSISLIYGFQNQGVKTKVSVLTIIPNDSLINFGFLCLRLWAVLISWS